MFYVLTSLTAFSVNYKAGMTHIVREVEKLGSSTCSLNSLIYLDDLVVWTL